MMQRVTSILQSNNKLCRTSYEFYLQFIKSSFSNETKFTAFEKRLELDNSSKKIIGSLRPPPSCTISPVKVLSTEDLFTRIRLAALCFPTALFISDRIVCQINSSMLYEADEKKMHSVTWWWFHVVYDDPIYKHSQTMREIWNMTTISHRQQDIIRNLNI